MSGRTGRAVGARPPPGGASPAGAVRQQEGPPPAPRDPPPRGRPRVADDELRAQLVQAHDAFRTLVRMHVGSQFATLLKFGQGPLPFITNLHILSHSHLFAGPQCRAILKDVSIPTAMERGDGQWEAAIRSLGGPRAGAPLRELTAAFDEHILPASSKPSTRSGNWRYWSCVVTWAIVHKATRIIMPMSKDLLKALTWDLITHATSHSVIRAVWSAVNARHRFYGYVPPLCERLEFTAWVRAIGCIMGRPLSLKLPIHKSVVARLLRWRPLTVALNRNRLIAALATLACMRVSEVARLQVCDLWFDFLTAWGIPGYEGTCGVHIYYRKNDTERKGHHPCLGRSQDPELDIVVQLQQWMQWLGLAVHPRCAKRRKPSARCPLCPPLFPTTQGGPAGSTVATTTPCSPQRVSDCIKRAVAAVGCDTRRFSGISARKGGLSTAIDAGVADSVLFLQSGHGQAKAAYNYMQIRDPRRLLETFDAFEL